MNNKDLMTDKDLKKCFGEPNYSECLVMQNGEVI